ncbi:MAG: endonuclease domain-containing protein [Armatimonas sp.]
MKPYRRLWRGVSPELRNITQEHRQNLTEAEQTLWKALQSGQLNGIRFRCQHAWETFIFDFYCPKRRLIIEVDGGYHSEPDQKEKDQYRDTYLVAHGVQILRFTNEQIFHELPSVLEQIKAVNPPSRRMAE